MPSRRLEDRVRQLCAKAITARGPELERTLEELQAALHEHIGKMRKMTAEKLLGKKEDGNRRSG